jgi:hypothetical protein
MSNAMFSWAKWSSLGVTLLAAGVFCRPVEGQNAPFIHVGGVEITGIPEDWSQRHLVFSEPGTEQEAIRNGRYKQWQTIVNNPRYIMHQLRRNARVQGPAAADVELRSRWISEVTGAHSPEAPESGPPQGFGANASRRDRRQPITTDWSVGLGGPGLRAGHYPAKYSLSPNTVASCSDYVVFPTGVAGAPNQATIVAFNNLYTGTCPQANNLPGVYWAYSIFGGTANTSPVLSLDGTQVAFVATVSGTAYLVILKMAQCTNNCSASLPDFSIQTFSAVEGAQYRACANTTGACYITFPLGGSDSNSAPFYRYDGSDTLYVGDDLARIHQFTGVFGPGNPSEGTPIQNFPGAQRRFNSPVYDSGSGLLFVTDSAGTLNSATTSGTNQSTSNRLDCGTSGFVGPPLIDSSQGQVYTFIGDGCDVNGGNSPGDSYINRFPVGTSINGNYGAPFSYQNSDTNSASTIGRLGAFDNAYLAGPGDTGRLYTCVNGRVYQASVSTLINTPTGGGPNNGVVQLFSTLVSAVNDSSVCSPVTEFFNAPLDRLFVSVQANGTGSCTGACLYSYDITSSPATLTPNAGRPENGGTSGIVIDNRLSTSGASQIYFNTLTGNNAVQASQSSLSQ